MGKGKRTVTGMRSECSLFCARFPFPPSPLPFPRSALRLLERCSRAFQRATREGRLAVFDDAWSRINDRYYDQTFHGVDWDSQRINFRAQAAEAGSSQELYAVLRRMIAPLNDPHTRVFAPEEKFDWWRPRFVTVGFSIAEVDGQPTVVSVERNSAPQRAGIRAGRCDRSIDGEAALTIVQKPPGRLARRRHSFGAFSSVRKTSGWAYRDVS